MAVLSITIIIVLLLITVSAFPKKPGGGAGGSGGIGENVGGASGASGGANGGTGGTSGGSGGNSGGTVAPGGGSGGSEGGGDSSGTGGGGQSGNGDGGSGGSEGGSGGSSGADDEKFEKPIGVDGKEKSRCRDKGVAAYRIDDDCDKRETEEQKIKCREGKAPVPEECREPDRDIISQELAETEPEETVEEDTSGEDNGQTYPTYTIPNEESNESSEQDFSEETERDPCKRFEQQCTENDDHIGAGGDLGTSHAGNSTMGNPILSTECISLEKQCNAQDRSTEGPGSSAGPGYTTPLATTPTPPVTVKPTSPVIPVVPGHGS